MSLLGAVPDRTARPRADPSWDVQALFLLLGKEPELSVTLRGAQASSHPPSAWCLFVAMELGP